MHCGTAKTLVLIASLVLSCACRTGNPDGTLSGDSKRPPDESQADGDDAVEPRPEVAFSTATEHVESARLLARPVEPLDSSVIQGLALPLYAELPSLNYEQMLGSVAQSGASHVSIVVSWDQRTVYANTIRPNQDKGPSDSRVGEVIDAARARGLQVMLFPIIHVKLRNTGEWRGKLAPEDPERWKREYRAFIMHYARLAQRHDVALFSVGSELGSMESDEAYWRALIKETRDTFDGKLIYSANWDHYTVPKYWDDLDYIGVSSYFEIADDESETVAEMVDRWRVFRDEMLAYSKQRDRPLLMTEVGYPSMPSAATKPWDYTKKSDADPNAQLAAFRALTDTWALSEQDAPYFGGVFVWHAWGAGGPKDSTYTVWGKPSERLIEGWFAR